MPSSITRSDPTPPPDASAVTSCCAAPLQASDDLATAPRANGGIWPGDGSDAAAANSARVAGTDDALRDADEHGSARGLDSQRHHEGACFRAALGAFIGPVRLYAAGDRDSLDDGGQATLFRTPSTSHVSNAFEARAEHLLRADRMTHIFSLAARMRRSDSQNVRGTAFGLGPVSLHDPEYGPEPGFTPPVGRIEDSTDHDTVAAGYRAHVGDRWELRAGRAVTRQQRSVRPIDGPVTDDDGTFVLPYASVAWVQRGSTPIARTRCRGTQRCRTGRRPCEGRPTRGATTGHDMGSDEARRRIDETIRARPLPRATERRAPASGPEPRRR